MLVVSNYNIRIGTDLQKNKMKPNKNFVFIRLSKDDMAKKSLNPGMWDAMKAEIVDVYENDQWKDDGDDDIKFSVGQKVLVTLDRLICAVDAKDGVYAIDAYNIVGLEGSNEG